MASNHWAQNQPWRFGMYTVSAYENSEIPDTRWLDQGTFATAADAIACAEGIIRKSLESLHRQNKRPGAESLRLAYACYGEVPSVFNDDGDPPALFDTYSRVRRQIEQITGEALPVDA
jgi:hypothetical protein